MTVVNAETGELLTTGVLRGDLSLTGYALPEGLSYDEWASEGSVLTTFARASMWWVGDWLCYGEARYGEKYAQAVEITGLATQTLMNAASVCNRIPADERRESLPFGHHKVVTALETSPRGEVLDLAESEGWSVRELEAEVKRRKNGHKPVAPRIEHDADAEMPTEFSAVVIDPPWRYGNTSTRGAAEDHYPTMSIEELRAVEIPAADDAHLYLWVTNGFLREAFELLDAWGFTYKACLTWCKPQIGMGNYFRNATEHVYFAMKGSLPTNANNISTWFEQDRTRHSAKPEAFYDIVERSSPGPYLEMFARRRRLGWHTWGNEA